jgi:hypothetical protein
VAWRGGVPRRLLTVNALDCLSKVSVMGPASPSGLANRSPSCCSSPAGGSDRCQLELYMVGAAL